MTKNQKRAICKQYFGQTSSSADYSPLLDIELSNFTPCHSIFGYSHSVSASRPAQIVTPPGLRASYTTFTGCRLHSRTRLPQRLSVLRLTWPAHCHFSMQIRCAMSMTLVLCRIIWFRIRSRRETPSIALSVDRNESVKRRGLQTVALVIMIGNTDQKGFNCLLEAIPILRLI
jgi:hypothetical protein